MLSSTAPMSSALRTGTAPSKAVKHVWTRQETDICDSLYGDSEELLGRWFKRTGKRNDIFLASKFGFVKGSKTLEIDSSGEYCKKACDESLRLLDTEYIDLCKPVSPKGCQAV